MLPKRIVASISTRSGAPAYGNSRITSAKHTVTETIVVPCSMRTDRERMKRLRNTDEPGSPEGGLTGSLDVAGSAKPTPVNASNPASKAPQALAPIR